MKRFLMFFVYVFGLSLAKAICGEDSTTKPECYRVYVAGIEAVYDEMKAGSWSYEASEYTWIQSTTICSYDVLARLICNLKLENTYNQSHTVVAYACSYMEAERGIWESQYLWLDEYRHPELLPIKDWSFSASLFKDCRRSDVAIFLCYNSVSI